VNRKLWRRRDESRKNDLLSRKYSTRSECHSNTLPGLNTIHSRKYSTRSECHSAVVQYDMMLNMKSFHCVTYTAEDALTGQTQQHDVFH